MGEELFIDTPRVFLPLLQPKRYKGAKGGRGSGKSHFFAELLIEECISQHTRAACMREVQNSIKDSVKQLLEDKIAAFDVADQFKVTEREIICPETESLIIFRGMQNHTVTSIKSLEGFNRGWVEEAQTISQRSLDIFRPTFRKNSEMWFSWNPDLPTDPVDVLFSENADDLDFICIEANYSANPFFPDELRAEMLRDRKRDLDKYNNIWLGKHRRNSQARVFKNFKSVSFITPDNAMFMHGSDWGFSEDPTVLVRAFTGRWEHNRPVYDPDGKILFIDHEAYGIGIEIDDTPRLFDELVTKNKANPDYQCARRWPIRADSARPETISYMRKHGYPLIGPADKGPNSVKEGVTFIQDYDVVIHPRCRHTLDEFLFYSFKIDPKTNAITSVLQDKKNHVIDSVRYAVEQLRKAVSQTKSGTVVGLI